MISAPLRLAVADSSVVVKWFREGEPLRPQALALRTAYLDGSLDLAIPDLLIYELANVLRYKRELALDDVCRAVRDMYDMDVAIVTVTADLATEAIHLARQFDVTVYDAAFLACAQQIGATLVTADDAFYRKMNGHPSVVHLSSMNPFAAQP